MPSTYNNSVLCKYLATVRDKGAIGLYTRQQTREIKLTNKNTTCSSNIMSSPTPRKACPYCNKTFVRVNMHIKLVHADQLTPINTNHYI